MRKKGKERWTGRSGGGAEGSEEQRLKCREAMEGGGEGQRDTKEAGGEGEEWEIQRKRRKKQEENIVSCISSPPHDP